MTMRRDRLDRPYLYIASKEGGLRIFNISDLSAPQSVKVIPTADLGGLQVMSLEQYGRYLYLALGNHFPGVVQSPGMAIVDVDEPEAAIVTDFWASPDFSSGGAGVVRAEGDYAYLGGMDNGLIILDVADKEHIAHVRNFKPDLDFPHGPPPPGDTAKFNARGMEIRNDTLWLCYDRGGLRVIDVRDKSAPVEFSRYCNSILTGFATAYNNIILRGNLAFLAIDYCGVEVLDVSDPLHIAQKGWWEPWTCPTNNPFVWGGSPGHANELAYDEDCKLLFVATGKSDLHILSVSDPAQPDSCGFFGGVDNQIGTWGVDLWQNSLFLSYIFTVVPFQSNWTGVKVLTYPACTPDAVFNPGTAPDFQVYPNPADGTARLQFTTGDRVLRIALLDAAGRPFRSFDPDNGELNLEGIPAGMYYLQVVMANGVGAKKLLITKRY